MSVAEIQQSVSALSQSERATLAAWLLESLPPCDEADAEAESVEEAVRRRAELDSGQVAPIPSTEFWTEVERERRPR